MEDDQISTAEDVAKNASDAVEHLIAGNLFAAIIAVAALIILCGGFYIVGKHISSKGLGQSSIQALVMIIVFPVLLILGAYSKLNPELIAGIIGTVVGYAFGRQDKA